MLNTLPEFIYPLRLAHAGEGLAGHLEVASMARLCGLLARPAGRVRVALRFGTDETGHAFARGLVGATVVLTCQRCLQAFEHTQEGAVAWRLAVGDDQARQLDGELEPLVVEEGVPVRLRDLVEDELILSLPAFPMHREPAAPCRRAVPEPDAPRTGVRENPFAVLAALKQSTETNR